jgi:hypothetical protein
MIGGDGLEGERVVLARKDARTMVGFQWTGLEPAGLNESDFAVALGAVWEGDQLVTYNLRVHARVRALRGRVPDRPRLGQPRGDHRAAVALRLVPAASRVPGSVPCHRRTTDS